MPREGIGSNKDGKHYWLTPPELFKELSDEFRFNYDPCPFPRVPEYDGLTSDWGSSSYVNPPFAGPTAWVRKAMAESEKMYYISELAVLFHQRRVELKFWRIK